MILERGFLPDFAGDLAGVSRLLRSTSALAVFLVTTLICHSTLGSEIYRGAGRPQQDITIDQIDALRMLAAELPESEADLKQRVETLCGQSLDGLNRVREIVALSEQFKSDSDTIDRRVRDIRRKLSDLQAKQPDPPTLAGLPQLEQEVRRREIELAELKAAQSKADENRGTRINRRREIRDALLSAGQRIGNLQKEIDAPPPANEHPLFTQARRMELRIRQMIIEADQPALMNELAKYDAEDTVEFMRLQRDVGSEEVRLATGELQILQDRLIRRRSADQAAALSRARAAVETTRPELKDWAQQNVEFANAAFMLSQPLESSQRNLEAIRTQLEELQAQFASTQKRVDEVGLTGSIGALLRRQLAELPDTRNLRRNVRDRKRLIEETQYTLFDYDEMRSESVDELARRMRSGQTLFSEEETALYDEESRELIEQRREFLALLIRTIDLYLDTLFELDATEQRIIRETIRYEEYIDERVFWIRSNRPLFVSFEVDESDRWALDRNRWSEVTSLYWTDVRQYYPIHGVVVLTFALLLWQKRRFRRELESTSQRAARSNCTEIAPTLRATFLTLLLSVIWPGLVFIVAWRLNEAANGSPFARAVSLALFALAYFYFPLEILRRICRPRGLADSHFDWSPSTILAIRAVMQWALPAGFLVVFATTLLFSSETEHEVDSLERISFVFGMALLSVAIFQALRPTSGIFADYLRSHPNGWFGRLKPIWYWGSVLAPLVLAGITVVGYYYTAQQLTTRLFASFLVIGAVQLLGALLRRLLLMHRRSISIEQSRERQAARSAIQANPSDSTVHSPTHLVAVEEMQTDVATSSQQSRRLVSMAVLAVSFAGMWMIWVDVLPALRFLDERPVWSSGPTEVADTSSSDIPVLGAVPPTGGEPVEATEDESSEILTAVTFADVGLAILIGFITFVCARNIPGLMEILILQRLPLDNSIRYALTTVTSYFIVLLGIILAFNAMSIGWSKVQWLATALTFGLAFGLQEIFANFVAGLILLFERPIRVGDVVTVDEVTGVVSRIRIRATTITNWDRKEYVIPNKEFITGRMLNWTLSDKTNRLVINVGVAYGSDIELAKELLRKTCEDHPIVLEDPPTLVTFEGFGDNSLNLVVRTFLPDLDNRLPVIDALHTAIDKAFRQANIEIAFPQRDLHIRSMDPRIVEEITERTETRAA